MNRTGAIKQGSGGRRSRRGNGKRNPKNQNFDSNGPDVRVRGNAQQVLDRYLTLARDAQAAGDRIASENYYQHAEHYYRILHANDDGERRGDHRQQPSQPADLPYDDDVGQDSDDDAVSASEPAPAAQAEVQLQAGEEAVVERTQVAAEGGNEPDSDDPATDGIEPPSTESAIL